LNNNKNFKKMPHGNLIVTLVRGELSHDTELIGDMDPYVEVIVGISKKSSNICHGGGKRPNFYN
jgi:hypothetical protein